MIGKMMKWLKNPMQQFCIRFLNAPREDHPDWQDPELQKKIRKMNYYIWFFMGLLILMILFLLFNISHAFSIRTNPPITFGGFRCDCSVQECVCKQGEISVSVVFLPEKKENWTKYATKNKFFGNVYCGETCVNHIGTVTAIRLPYLSLSTLETAERSAALTLKKSMTISEKASSLISAVLQSVGIKTESDESSAIIREKALSTLKKQAEQMNIDMTTYIIHDILVNVLGKKEPKLSDYFTMINIMSELNRRGQLNEFLAWYFLTKAKPEMLVYLDPVIIKWGQSQNLKKYLDTRLKILEIYKNCSEETVKECWSKIEKIVGNETDVKTKWITLARVQAELALATNSTATENIFQGSAERMLFLDGNPIVQKIIAVIGIEKIGLGPDKTWGDKIVKFDTAAISRIASKNSKEYKIAAHLSESKVSEAFEENERKKSTGNGLWKGFIFALILLIVSYLFYILYGRKKSKEV